MARKVDACMFCMGDGCDVCVKKPKKQAQQKSDGKQALSGNVRLPEVDAPPPTPQGEVLDLKAAMRKAANSQATNKPPESADDTDPELAVALVALEPILHPDERTRFSLVLEKLGTRAQRWKLRHHG